MKPALKTLEAQLKAWELKIHQLVALTQKPGVQAGFDSLIHVDELKALHAIARVKLDEFKVAETEDRTRLKKAMERVWSELDAAIKRPMP